jgi:hypothetical protein
MIQTFGFIPSIANKIENSILCVFYNERERERERDKERMGGREGKKETNAMQALRVELIQ